MKIQWPPLALDRVSEIADYISRDNPSAALSWVESLLARVGRLKSFPDSGRPVPEVDRQEIREILYGSYRIIYRRDESSISILTVRHGKQLLSLEDLQ